MAMAKNIFLSLLSLLLTQNAFATLGDLVTQLLSIFEAAEGRDKKKKERKKKPVDINCVHLHSASEEVTFGKGHTEHVHILAEPDVTNTVENGKFLHANAFTCTRAHEHILLAWLL